MPLEAETAAEAQEEFRKLLAGRSEDSLPHLGRSRKFSDYVAQTYEKRLRSSGKKPDIRGQNPEADEAEIERLLKERLALSRSL